MRKKTKEIAYRFLKYSNSETDRLDVYEDSSFNAVMKTDHPMSRAELIKCASYLTKRDAEGNYLTREEFQGLERFRIRSHDSNVVRTLESIPGSSNSAKYYEQLNNTQKRSTELIIETKKSYLVARPRKRRMPAVLRNSPGT